MRSAIKNFIQAALNQRILAIGSFVVFLLTQTGISQTINIDTSLLSSHRDHAKEWLHINSDSSIFYYEQAIRETNRLANSLSADASNMAELSGRLSEILVRCNIDLGNELFWKGNYSEALSKYNLGLEGAINIENLGMEGECYGEMATVYRNLGKHSEALDYNTKALSIADNMNDDYWVGILHNNRGVILQAIGDYPGALKSFFKALELYEKIPGVFSNVELLNIGKVYELQGDRDQALKYYEQSLKIVQDNKLESFRIAECYLAIGDIHLNNNVLNKARRYFFDALDILLEGGHHYRIDYCYSQLGETYLRENNNGKAIEYFNNSLEISREKNEVITEGNTLLKLSELYLKSNDLITSLDYAQSALRIANSTSYLELKRDSYEQLIDIYEQKGNYQTAFNYQKMNNVVKDSLFNDQKLRALTDMEAKYETERKEMELFLVQEQKNNAEQKLYSNRIVYIAIIVFLILGSLFIIISFILSRLRSRLKLQAYEQEQIILKREFEQKKSALQILTLKNQLNPHFIFNVLNSIGSSIIKEKKTKAYDLLTNFSELIRSSLDQADKMSVPLSQELEFVNNYLVLERNRFKDIFDYKVTIAKDVSQDSIIPRMAIQVFVENAIKHGLRYKEKDGMLNILINQEGQSLNIAICDNGVGRKIASSMPSSSTGKGLAIISELFKIYEHLHNIQIGYNIDDKYDNEGNSTGTDVLLSIPINGNNGRSKA